MIKPANKKELENIILLEMAKYGHQCDLNHIDISAIDDLSLLFFSDPTLQLFNGDISRWNTSQVINMSGMFESSQFNGDIIRWDVSSVQNMSFMFACSQFNSDLSSWNVEKVQFMDYMFSYSHFNYFLDSWNPQQLDSFVEMFDHATCSKPYWFIENKLERQLALGKEAKKRQLASELFHSLDKKSLIHQVKI